MWSFSFHREVLYHPVMKTLLLSLSVLPMGIFLSSEVKVIFIAVCSQWCFFPVLRKSVIIDDRKVYLVFKEMGHLQLSNHMVQNRHTGKQMTHWDMLNKENSNLVAFFNMSQSVICSPVWRFLYHVIAQLQKAHWVLFGWESERGKLGIKQRDEGKISNL